MLRWTRICDKWCIVNLWGDLGAISLRAEVREVQINSSNVFAKTDPGEIRTITC
jgi:hypothetical protein